MKEKKELNYYTVTEYFKTLPYTEQKSLFTALSFHIKTAPYYITFKLDPSGVYRMAKVIAYCDKYSIEYTPEKLGNQRVKFRFEELSERNSTLLGRFTME